MSRRFIFIYFISKKSKTIHWYGVNEIVKNVHGYVIFVSKNFKADIFISGFFGNSILAACLAYLGDKLGIPMYIAAVIVFGGRIFDNFAIIRRILLDRLKTKDKV